MVPRLALAVLLLAALVAGLRHVRGPGTPESPPPSGGPGTLTAPWWPLTPGTAWEYAVLTSSGRTGRLEYRVDGPSQGGVRVFEAVDGRQTDDFVVRSGPGDAVVFREYQAGKHQVQYLPETLEPGANWNLKADLKARAVELEEREVPALDPPREAMRIEYQSWFGPERTKDPGWYPEAIRWYVRGIGLVEEDLREARSPPDVPFPGEDRRLRLRLVKFVPGRR